MTSFLYVGDDERFYPTLNVIVHPGDTFEADENPDPPHFDEVSAAPPLTAPTPDPAV